ncbi:MAG: hypothetical protein ABJV68_31980 [Paracoccaceae bacterium]
MDMVATSPGSGVVARENGGGQYVKKPIGAKQVMEVDQLKRDFQFNINANVWSLKEKAGAFTYSDGDENENYLLSVMKKASDHSLVSEELSLAM